MNTVVCGIDPGLGVTGYGIVRCCHDGLTLIDAGTCRLNPQEALPRRLAALEADVTSLFCERRPDVVAVEQLYSHYRHPRTAILMGHARGAILLAAAKQGIDIRDYAATRIKRFATGNGRASKAQVQRAVQSAFKLAELPEPPDVADALAIAMCCASEFSRVQPVGVSV